MNLKQAIQAYIEKFNEGPPIMGMEETEAIKKILDSIDNNAKIEQGAENNLPNNVLI